MHSRHTKNASLKGNGTVILCMMCGYHIRLWTGGALVTSEIVAVM